MRLQASTYVDNVEPRSSAFEVVELESFCTYSKVRVDKLWSDYADFFLFIISSTYVETKITEFQFRLRSKNKDLVILFFGKSSPKTPL